MARITIIIPSYEGRQLLPRTLAHLEQVLGGSEARPDVMVVDDGSSDGSVEYLRKHHPDLRLLALESNRGFGAAVNDGVQTASTPLVYLMNSDVLPHEGFLEPLARRFEEDPELFAAMSLNVDTAGHVSQPTQVSPRLGRGQIRVKGLDLEAAWRAGTLVEQGPIATLFGSGGSVLLRRDRFLELGGFSEMFRPYYYEDTDLGWRAWRRGWRSVLEPASVVTHDHRESSIASTQDRRAVRIHRKRNRFLLLWRNLLDPRQFLVGHLLPLPLYLLGRALTLDFTTLRGFLRALPERRAVVHHRRAERAAEKLTTAEILSILEAARREIR